MRWRPLYLLTITWIFLPTLLHAEEPNGQPAFVCTSEVYYSWRRDGEEEELREFFSSLQRGAQTEEVATKELTLQLKIAEREALEHCRKRHENLSGCIAARFASMTELFRTLSFEARSRMEKAVEQDCMTAFGICRGTDVSEIVCEGQAVEAEPEGRGGRRR